jgi:hypothetical protein
MDTSKRPPESPGVAAEPDRVSTRLVVGFGIVLIVLGLVTVVVTVATFRGFDRSAEKKDDRVVEAAGLQLREGGLPPLPRLQIYPARHWKDFEAAESQRLTTYGWMDRATGVVHIPIDQAITLIAERGVGPLPAAPVAVPGPAPTPGPGGKP